MTETVVAIDIGGTKIACALVTSEGQILSETQRSTDAIVNDIPRDGDEIYAGLAAALTELLIGKDIPQRVGIGSAGPIHLSEGSISPLNIPGWRQYPIVAKVNETLAKLGRRSTETVLIGDGHCVALGEQWLGAGQGYQSIIGVICSTGVGAGVVIDGHAYQGRTGNAVHLGHQSVDINGRLCACGSRGCVEALSSGTSLTAIAKEQGWNGNDTQQLVADANAGNTIALSVIDNGMQALAAGLAGCATVFDVPVIVVGGGVSKAGDTIFEPLRRHFAHYCKLAYVSDEACILQATLPNAGLLGAAKAALDTR
ncbi:MAG: ROK family protein [Propionibacteriaceae bacterium]